MALLRNNSGATRANRHATVCRQLAGADPFLKQVIARVGPCGLSPRRDYFGALCDSIISQQLSAQVAATIFNRFAGLFPGRRPNPDLVARTSLLTLSKAGLSPQKARYIKEVAEAFLAGGIQPKQFSYLSNEEIIELLTAIKGIGRWTAEMFLIFSLNRFDVLPLDDLGIRKAIQRCYRLDTLPSPTKVRSIAKTWHPYESIACWYLWRSLKP